METFIKCEKCGKKLIKRLPNGLGEFKFGKQAGQLSCPVNMVICGMVQLKCLSRSCNHVQTYMFFPLTTERIDGFSQSVKTEPIAMRSSGDANF